MAIYTQRFNVFGVATYPTDAQVVIPFTPRSIKLILEDTTDDAYVSVTGDNNAPGAHEEVHLVPAVPGVPLMQQVTKLWLKRGAAGTDTTYVQIIAEQ